MRTILLALALLLPLHASANDKLKHFAASAAIAGVTYYVTGDTAALSLTDAQLDQLFITAAGIEA